MTLVYGAISRLITLYESSGLFLSFRTASRCVLCGGPGCLQCEPACAYGLWWEDFSSTQKQQAMRAEKKENNKYTQPPVVVLSIHSL